MENYRAYLENLQQPGKFVAIFLPLTAFLALLNVLTYPYLPLEGVALSCFLLISASIFSYVLYSRNLRLRGKMVVFPAFTLTVLASRVFVNVAGIATPGAQGDIGPFSISQLWLNGFHVHHYWIGLGFLTAVVYTRERFSDTANSVLVGLGLALVVDEFGILFAGHTYHSWISYASLFVVTTAILLVVLRDSDLNFL